MLLLPCVELLMGRRKRQLPLVEGGIGWGKGDTCRTGEENE